MTTTSRPASIVWVSPWGSVRSTGAPPVYHVTRDCIPPGSNGHARPITTRRVPTALAAAREAGVVPCKLCHRRNDA